MKKLLLLSFFVLAVTALSAQSLSGYFTNKGKPAANIEVKCECTGNAWYPVLQTFYTTTNSQGVYVFYNLPSGNYIISIIDPNTGSRISMPTSGSTGPYGDLSTLGNM